MATPSRKGRRSDGAQFRVPFAAADLGKAWRESVHCARSNTCRSTYWPRATPFDDGRQAVRRRWLCAMLVPKLAVMAWYGVHLSGRRSFRRLKDFSNAIQIRILRCSVRRNPSVSRSPVRTIQASERCTQLQPRSGDLRPNLAVLAGCYSLLFRRRVAKKRGFPRWTPAPSLFFRCISAKTAAASARR